MMEYISIGEFDVPVFGEALSVQVSNSKAGVNWLWVFGGITLLVLTLYIVYSIVSREPDGGVEKRHIDEL